MSAARWSCHWPRSGDRWVGGLRGCYSADLQASAERPSSELAARRRSGRSGCAPRRKLGGSVAARFQFVGRLQGALRTRQEDVRFVPLHADRDMQWGGQELVVRIAENGDLFVPRGVGRWRLDDQPTEQLALFLFAIQPLAVALDAMSDLVAGQTGFVEDIRHKPSD